MAYDESPRKKIEIREGKGRAGHDELISRATESGKYGNRTDAAAEEMGYLGMDDLNRIRRERLRKQTK